MPSTQRSETLVRPICNHYTESPPFLDYECEASVNL